MLTFEDRQRGGLRAGKTQKAKADGFAEQFRPLVVHYRRSGKSYDSIASILNERGIKSYRGGQWHRTQVQRLAYRLGIAGLGKK
jgi:hypothetical protein